MKKKYIFIILLFLIFAGNGRCGMCKNYLTQSNFDFIRDYIIKTGIVNKGGVHVNNNIHDDFYISFHEQPQAEGYLNIGKRQDEFFFEIRKLQEKNNHELLIEVYKDAWVDYKKNYKYNYEGDLYKDVNVYFKQILDAINDKNK
jgi:hypothetical protein